MYDVTLLLATLTFFVVSFCYIRSNVFNVFHPFTLYLAFHGFLFVIRPIISWKLNFRFVYILYQFMPTDIDKSTAILAATLGMLSFAFFCFRQGAVAMNFKLDRITFIERRALIKPFMLAAFICFPFGFYSLLKAWQATNDGLATASMVTYHGTQANIAGNGYFNDAQLMLVSCGAIFAWLFRFRLLALMPLAIFVLIRAGTGGRGPFVAAVAMLGLLWLYDRRQELPSLWISLGLVLMVAAFNYVGADRGRAIRQWIGTDKTMEYHHGFSYRLLPLEGMDFANLEYLEYVVYAVPQRTHTYSFFTDQLELLTDPVPRSLWPGKPFGSPVQLFDLYDYGFPVGITESLPGVGWVGGGWIGVVFWCGLWGYALGWLYRKFATGSQTTFQTIVYMTVLSSMIVAYRDGTLVTVARQNVFFMTPILLWLVFARLWGVRSALDVRRMLAGQNGQAAPAMQKTARVSLPAAVVRRRIALAAHREEIERETAV